MMSISEKIDALYGMADTEQKNGTEKLREAEVTYDDGTIQGVMEHIPTSGGGGDFLLFDGVTYINNGIIAEDILVNGEVV